MVKGQLDERKTAAASYILNFYQEISNLTHNYSTYHNLLIEIRNKYKDLDLNKLSPDERNALMQTAQSVRYYAHECFIMYQTLLPPLKIKKDENIQGYYDQIKKDYIIKIEDLEQYVIILNSVLINNIIKELIDTSQYLIEGIYGTEEKKQPTE